MFCSPPRAVSQKIKGIYPHTPCNPSTRGSASPAPSPPPAAFPICVLSFSRISAFFPAVLSPKPGVNMNDPLCLMETAKLEVCKTIGSKAQVNPTQENKYSHSQWNIQIFGFKGLSKELGLFHLGNFRRRKNKFHLATGRKETLKSEI